MRLYSTLQRELVELPPPEAGPVRMYFCGPTVYQRAHIGNARPFVLGMWLRAWLRHRGYDAKLVHNITDINDKIYDASPGASAELAAQATAWYLQDTADLGLGMPVAVADYDRGTGVLLESLLGGLGALIVLGFVFASFLALVPMAMAIVSIMTTFLLVWGLTTFTDICELSHRAYDGHSARLQLCLKALHMRAEYDTLAMLPQKAKRRP